MADDKNDDTTEAPETEEEMSSAEALKKGMGLLWKAAKTAADEIQRDVDVDAVKTSLKRAGKDIEDAANQAAKAVEDFVDRQTGNPSEPTPGPTATPAPGAQQVDADIPDDGGTDDNGEERDFRIQVDD